MSNLIKLNNLIKNKGTNTARNNVLDGYGAKNFFHPLTGLVFYHARCLATLLTKQTQWGTSLGTNNMIMKQLVQGYIVPVALQVT